MAVSNFKYMIFRITLPESIANYHAMEGYFAEIGYEIECIEHQPIYYSDSNRNSPYWRVWLAHKSPDVLLLDVLAGRFNNLEKKILKLKKIQLAG